MIIKWLNQDTFLRQALASADSSIRLASEIQHTKYPGKLIVVEGLDGAGKSSNIKHLKKYLKRLGHNVHVTAWNSAKNISKAIKQIKKDKDAADERKFFKPCFSVFS